MPEDVPKPLSPLKIADQLYDIALDPQSIERFIDAWNEAGLDSSAARRTIEDIDQFDEVYRAHLDRANIFLERGGARDAGPDLAAILSPFENLAALIFSPNLDVAASNAGAQRVFGIKDGDGLNALSLPRGALDKIGDALATLFRDADTSNRLLKIEIPGQPGTALFQFRKLQSGDTKRCAHVLVVTTRYHWRAALGDTLKEVFNLTAAEQGVVRALVEGLDAKAISAERGTSEGTVRGQIKSILAKMNARTQSEVIRLVMSLRDISEAAIPLSQTQTAAVSITSDWLSTEVWKPFKTLVMPDGRRLDYHDMGPITGAPVLYSHMGYCLARWHKPMLKLAFSAGLRVICPIRAGYGQSDNLENKADVLAATRADTKYLLDHLGIDRLPYVTQGNDLIFATDFAGQYPDRISEIIGICARPSLRGDKHYAGMAKWHRFFLSTAKHAPHLLVFTFRAAVAMTRRIGNEAMFRQLNRRSAGDMALLDDKELFQVLAANAALVVGQEADVARAYTMEIVQTEADWSDLMMKCAGIKTWFVNGGQDPAVDIATIAEYREAYPWIEIEVLPDAGQLLIFQHYEHLIPRFAEAAKQAQRSNSGSKK